jgi:hypothetical protein
LESYPAHGMLINSMRVGEVITAFAWGSSDEHSLINTSVGKGRCRVEFKL